MLPFLMEMGLARAQMPGGTTTATPCALADEAAAASMAFWNATELSAGVRGGPIIAAWVASSAGRGDVLQQRQRWGQHRRGTGRGKGPQASPGRPPVWPSPLAPKSVTLITLVYSGMGWSLAAAGAAPGQQRQVSAAGQGRWAC